MPGAPEEPRCSYNGPAGTHIADLLLQRVILTSWLLKGNHEQKKETQPSSQPTQGTENSCAGQEHKIEKKKKVKRGSLVPQACLKSNRAMLMVTEKMETWLLLGVL